MLRVIRTSKRAQLLLVVLAAVVSFVPLVAERRQGNSIRWTVDEEIVHCEYSQWPSFSHIRSYVRTKILGVTRAPDSRDDSVQVVRLQLNGMNLNIPSQSDELIWNFDAYLNGLQVFMAHAKGGELSRTYTWYHPWLIVGAVSAPVAVALWVLVFTVLLFGSKRHEVPAADQPS